MKSNTPLTIAQIYQFVLGNFDQIGDEAYEGLYAHYTSPERGEDAMPYGTAKARDGDPYIWIENELRKEIEAESGLPMEKLNEAACELAEYEFGVFYLHEAIHRAFHNGRMAAVNNSPFFASHGERIDVTVEIAQDNAATDAIVNKLIMQDDRLAEAIAMMTVPTNFEPSIGCFASPEAWDKVSEIEAKDEEE